MFLGKLSAVSCLIAKRLCEYRGRPFADAIEKSVDTFHRLLNNVDFNMSRNGELRVLRIFSKFDPTCFFDVGANKGDWCKAVSLLCPSSTIHAFEIVPSTYREFVKNINGLRNVIPNNFGLSFEEGVVPVSFGSDTSIATGCDIEGMRLRDKYYCGEIKCDVRKASDYMKEKGVGSVDFLKVDVEGMEFKVIRGFGDLIRNVRAVQFEYGVFNIASHDLLSDCYMHFKKNGFVVGKIFPRCVNFSEYHFNMENFHGSNYLAVRSDEKELIGCLSKFGAD